MKISYKYLSPSLLVILLGAAASCRADSVDIGVAGHMYGSYTLGANQTVSETFTLNQNTRVTSLTFGIAPEGGGFMFNGSFQVIVSGAGGIYYQMDEQSLSGSPNYQITTPLPDILPAGEYDITFDGGPCSNPCYSFVAGIDYFSPAIYQGVGGSAQGPFGFQLKGENTPEPGTWILAATALAFLPARRYLLRRS